MSFEASALARAPQSGDAVVVLDRVGKLFPAARPSLLDALRNRITQGFAALSDISLTVRQGETLGILGSNGAGKSTLLQIIVGVLAPTSGTVTRQGRVAALLELGAGFNPLWTGRRNAEFYCMVQGCDRATMPARLREIEDFADIGAFFDRPMRTYSSGMFMRVAFAAAMASDPDIFIVDEALAVGDARFQKKCFGYFTQLQAQGKTIILVSHDPMLVSRFCTHGVVLDGGRLVMHGSARDAAAAYMGLIHGGDAGAPDGQSDTDADVASAGEVTPPGGHDPGRHLFRWPPEDAAWRTRPHYNREEAVLGRMIGHITDLVLTDAEGSICGPTVAAGSRLTLTAQIRALCDVQKPHFGLMITTQEDAIVVAVSNTMLGEPDIPLRAGEELTVGFTFDLPLARGDYFIDFGLAEAAGESLDVLEWRRGVSHLVVTNSSNATGIVDTRAVYRRG